MLIELHGADLVAILIVEDDQIMSKLIKQNLEDESIRVVEAATGLECIRIIREAKVDLILLDIRLPDFSGWGILSLIRLTEKLHKIPVIVVSVEPPNAALLEQYKPNGYIQKPFDIRHLLAEVKTVIGV